MLEYQKSSAARMVHLAGRFRQFKVTTHHCSIHRYSKTLANQHICAVAGFGGWRFLVLQYEETAKSGHCAAGAPTASPVLL